MSRSRCQVAGALLAGAAATAAVTGCSDDEPPGWEEWSSDHLQVLEVDDVAAAGAGDGIEVSGRITDVDDLAAAVDEVCGYTDETGERVGLDVEIASRGRLSGGCDDPGRAAWPDRFAALTTLDGVDEVILVGGLPNLRVAADDRVVDVATRVLATVAEDPPSLLFVDSENVHVRWTPDERDLTDELDLLDRLLGAAGDRVDDATLSDRRVVATVEGDGASLSRLREQLGADADDLELTPVDDR